jgi:hypothetical protein
MPNGTLPALLEKRADLNADAIRTFVRRRRAGFS